MSEEIAPIDLGYQPHVLVIDDDSRLCALLERYLKEHGYLVTKAASAEMSLAYIEAFAFDAIIADVMMPGMTGLEMTERLRSDGCTCPVLVLSARGEPTDRIKGLQAGANDYLAKPFEPKELLLRLKNLIRRPASEPHEQAITQISLGDNTLDLERGTIKRGDSEQRLTSSECQVLQVLLSRPGSIVSRETLVRTCADVSNDRSIDVLIARLRRKLDDATTVPRWLVTHRGQGYALHLDVSRSNSE